MNNSAVLVASGDPYRLQMLNFYFQREGFKVETARDGLEAFGKAAVLQPQVIVAATDLSGIDGYELCRRVKTHPKTGPIPVILVSPRHARPSRELAGRAGADDFFVAPIFFRDLSGAAVLLLRRAQASKGKKVQGDLAEVPVVQLARIFHGGRRSGSIQVQSGEATGTLAFHGGELTYARSGRAKGELAFFRLLTWEAGQFELALGEVAPDHNVKMQTRELLARASFFLAEWRRPSALTPVIPAGSPSDSTKVEVDLAYQMEAKDVRRVARGEPGAVAAPVQTVSSKASPAGTPASQDAPTEPSPPPARTATMTSPAFDDFEEQFFKRADRPSYFGRRQDQHRR